VLFVVKVYVLFNPIYVTYFRMAAEMSAQNFIAHFSKNYGGGGSFSGLYIAPLGSLLLLLTWLIKQEKPTFYVIWVSVYTDRLIRIYSENVISMTKGKT